MDRLRRLLGRRSTPRSSQEYERLAEDTSELENSDVLDHYDNYDGGEEEVPFSWFEYAIFVLLGMAMLWAWYV